MAGRIVLQLDSGLGIRTVTQVAHGLSLGDPVRLQGTESYVKAQGNTDINAEFVGLIIEVIDVDNFRVQYSGFINDTNIVPNQPSGTVYFLDPTVLGGITNDDSTFVATNISKPIFTVVVPNQELFILQHRGVEITASLTEYIREPIYNVDATIASTRTITLTNAPISGTENVIINGQIVYEGVSEAYTISGSDIIFNGDVNLTSGYDKIRVDYNYN